MDQSRQLDAEQQKQRIRVIPGTPTEMGGRKNTFQVPAANFCDPCVMDLKRATARMSEMGCPLAETEDAIQCLRSMPEVCSAGAQCSGFSGRQTDATGAHHWSLDPGYRERLPIVHHWHLHRGEEAAPGGRGGNTGSFSRPPQARPDTPHPSIGMPSFPSRCHEMRRDASSTWTHIIRSGRLASPACLSPCGACRLTRPASCSVCSSVHLLHGRMPRTRRAELELEARRQRCPPLQCGAATLGKRKDSRPLGRANRIPSQSQPTHAFAPRRKRLRAAKAPPPEKNREGKTVDKDPRHSVCVLAPVLGDPQPLLHPSVQKRGLGSGRVSPGPPQGGASLPANISPLARGSRCPHILNPNPLRPRRGLPVPANRHTSRRLGGQRPTREDLTPTPPSHSHRLGFEKDEREKGGPGHVPDSRQDPTQTARARGEPSSRGH